jgi:GPI-anchor transamidase subunit U
MATDLRTLGVLGSAAALRLAAFLLFPNVPDLLSSQVELSTPISSFKRVREGLFLYERGVSPYDGGVYHQAPLLLTIFGIFPPSLVFTGLDILGAICLKSLADNIRLSSPRFKPLDGTIIAAAYLFNPFTIFSCLGRSTSVLTNTAILEAVLSAHQGNAIQSMLALAFGAYLNMYPALLLPPILLLLGQATIKSKPNASTLTTSVACFALALLALISSTLLITGNIPEFVRSCYGFQLTVPDLTPNIGLWWYFFIEMFDPFRAFFIGVFWLHMAGYVGGMTIRLHKEPVFVVTSLLGLFAAFKPYPNIADAAIYLGMLPLYQHIIPRESEHPFPVLCTKTSSDTIHLHIRCCHFVLDPPRSCILLPVDLCRLWKCELLLRNHTGLESWAKHSCWRHPLRCAER